MKYLPKILLVLLLLLVACQGEDTTSEDIGGRVLIWHTWEGVEREALVDLLNDFMEINPGVILVEESLSAREIVTDFIEQASSGYGPDIIMAPAELSPELAQRGVIRDLSNQGIDTDIYLSSAVGILQDGNTLHGIPLSLNTFALYYNRALLGESSAVSSVEEMLALIEEQQQAVTNTVAIETLNNLAARLEVPETTTLEPAASLETLLQQADMGHRVALRSDFYGAFWGIQTFGGQLFDDENRVVLNQGGFANWLNWLKQANNNPSVVLHRRADVLQELFTSGQATYYVGNSQELPRLQEALGVDMVGVARLPGRPNKPAGPFLEVETIMFNRATSGNSLEVGLHLAQYLTNVEQQQELALSAGRLPVNKRVQIDPRVSPIMAELVAQSRTAVPISIGSIDQVNDIIAFGDPIYTLVLDGEVSVGEAATQLTTQVNDKYNLETLVADVADCTASGRITLQHALDGDAEAALNNVADEFIRNCPGATIALEHVEAVELYNNYLNAADGDERPDMILGNNRWLVDFALAEAIQNIADLVDSEFTQRYMPVVEQSAIYENRLYGIPVTMNSFALYFNRDVVQDPPVVLDDLLTVVSDEAQLGLPIGFYESYWGISAFGESTDSPLFDEEGRLIIGQGGLTEWLAWLKAAQNEPNIFLNSDQETLHTMFVAGEIAYLADESSLLSQLQEELGTERIGVVPLPSGAPLLLVDLFMINPQSSETQQALALAFAQYASGVESQETWLQQANRVPTNVNVDTSAYPAITGFMEQIETALPVPNIPAMKTVFEWGDLVYEQVLINEIEPIDAVADFTNVVDVTNGFEVVVAEDTVIEDCTDEGQVTLWHSWSEAEQLAWGQVISDFVQLCPQIEIATVFIPAEEFTRQLTTTLEAESELPPPDFFIASHDDLEMYEAAGLVGSISSFVDDTFLIDYLPKAVTAMSLGEELYGLPQAVALQGLYYRPELVAEPATTFEALLTQANEGLTIGLPANFIELFWGASAFGCLPCQAGTFLDEQGDLALSPSDFADWVSWLEAAQATGSVIVSDNKAALVEMFIAGELAYLVDSSADLSRYQIELGVANVGVTALPVGDDDQKSVPLIQVNGFMFYREAIEAQTALAFKFAQFATAQASQVLLIDAANYVPTNNLAAITTDDEAVLVFIDELETTILLPSSTEREIIMSNRTVYTLYERLAVELEEIIPSVEDGS